MKAYMGKRHFGRKNTEKRGCMEKAIVPVWLK